MEVGKLAMNGGFLVVWARVRLCLSALVIMVLVSCAGNSDDDYSEKPVEELYGKAQKLLDDGDFEEAASAFQEVERQHPYSEWAVRGKLMSAFAYYQGQFYIDAVAGLESFIDLHPGHKDVAYARYLIGRSYYDQISDVGRDQEMTKEALKAFEELMRRFPDSDYAKDATLKADLARDHLAGKEIQIGRYYQGRQQYVAAVNRFRTVIDQYQTTTHVPEALHRLAESYLALGIVEEARQAAAVLGHNYPDSEWYARAYALVEEGKTGPADEGVASWLSDLF